MGVSLLYRCKRSNKKHKTWEGDGESVGPFLCVLTLSSQYIFVAILVVRGNGVILKDMDGKE